MFKRLKEKSKVIALILIWAGQCKKGANVPIYVYIMYLYVSFKKQNYSICCFEYLTSYLLAGPI